MRRLWKWLTDDPMDRAVVVYVIPTVIIYAIVMTLLGMLGKR